MPRVGDVLVQTDNDGVWFMLREATPEDADWIGKRFESFDFTPRRYLIGVCIDADSRNSWNVGDACPFTRSRFDSGVKRLARINDLDAAKAAVALGAFDAVRKC